MVISPQNGCTWTYKDGKLGINITSDDGLSYLFTTHYEIERLFRKPEINAPFCVEDANLLTAYMSGLSEIIPEESQALDLGLNGVACQRFTRPTAPTSRYFFQIDNGGYVPQMGDVVTVYAKSGEAGDCLVLDPQEADGVCRLMLLNKDLMIDQGRGYLLGMMIRVQPFLVNPYRGFDGHTKGGMYA